CVKPALPSFALVVLSRSNVHSSQLRRALVLLPNLYFYRSDSSRLSTILNSPSSLPPCSACLPLVRSASSCVSTLNPCWSLSSSDYPVSSVYGFHAFRFWSRLAAPSKSVKSVAVSRLDEFQFLIRANLRLSVAVFLPSPPPFIIP